MGYELEKRLAADGQRAQDDDVALDRTTAIGKATLADQLGSASRDAAAVGKRAGTGELDEVDEALARAGTGNALHEELRKRMEAELGYDLGRVRVHTDAVAADAAQAVGAHAFTVGEDIYFARGAYAPESAAGAKLIAHELTHVVQALQGRARTPSTKHEVSDPSESLEREADSVADRFASKPAESARATTTRVIAPRPARGGMSLPAFADQAPKRAKPVTRENAPILTRAAAIPSPITFASAPRAAGVLMRKADPSGGSAKASGGPSQAGGPKKGGNDSEHTLQARMLPMKLHFVPGEIVVENTPENDKLWKAMGFPATPLEKRGEVLRLEIFKTKIATLPPGMNFLAAAKLPTWEERDKFIGDKVRDLIKDDHEEVTPEGRLKWIHDFLSNKTWEGPMDLPRGAQHTGALAQQVEAQAKKAVADAMKQICVTGSGGKSDVPEKLRAICGDAMDKVLDLADAVPSVTPPATAKPRKKKPAGKAKDTKAKHDDGQKQERHKPATKPAPPAAPALNTNPLGVEGQDPNRQVGEMGAVDPGHPVAFPPPGGNEASSTDAGDGGGYARGEAAPGGLGDPAPAPMPTARPPSGPPPAAPPTPAAPAAPAAPGAAPAAPGPAPRVTHSAAAFITGAAPERTTVGIGETINFMGNVKGNWTATTAGAGGVTSVTDDYFLDWIANDTAGSATIRFDAGNGAPVIETVMTVIAPSGIDFVEPTSMSYPAGQMGAGMVTKVKFLPYTVDFSALSWKETPGPASNIAGYFTSHAPPYHNPNPAWLPREGGGTDTAAFWGFPAPWADGSFVWEIPQSWALTSNTGAGTLIQNVTQQCTLTAAGVTTVTKGSASATRAAGTPAPRRGGRGHRGEGGQSEGFGMGEGNAVQPTPIQATFQIDKPTPGRVARGFIDTSDGANIRTKPLELGGASVMTGPVLPGTPVTIGGTHPSAPEWTYVTAQVDANLVRGYVQKGRITTDLPEPTAELYQIKSGDTVEKLAVKKFKSSVQDGQDLRFYENVLLKVNKEKGRAGITGTYQDPGILGGGANNIQLVAGHRIWLVSPEYAKALGGTIPSGSLTGGAVAKVKRFGQHLSDIIASVGQSPQFIPEVAGEYAQVLYDNMTEIVVVTAAFLGAELLSAALAAVPTGVTQIVAAIIQLIVAAVGYIMAGLAIVDAAKHGATWLESAWTANGDEKKLALASKEFLKMIVSIVMAVMSAKGANNNFAKAEALMPSVPMTPAYATVNGVRTGVGAAEGAMIGPPSNAGPLGAGGTMMSVNESKNGGGNKSEPNQSKKPEPEPNKSEGPAPKVDATKPAVLDASMSLARPAEQATAARVAAQKPQFNGRTFKGVPPPDPGYDWVDDLGRHFDAMGDGTKAKYFKFEQFKESIDAHLRKGNDFTVIDMTGNTPEQIAEVAKYLDSINNPTVIRIGF